MAKFSYELTSNFRVRVAGARSKERVVPILRDSQMAIITSGGAVNPPGRHVSVAHGA